MVVIDVLKTTGLYWVQILCLLKESWDRYSLTASSWLMASDSSFPLTRCSKCSTQDSQTRKNIIFLWISTHGKFGFKFICLSEKNRERNENSFSTKKLVGPLIQDQSEWVIFYWWLWYDTSLNLFHFLTNENRDHLENHHHQASLSTPTLEIWAHQ